MFAYLPVLIILYNLLYYSITFCITVFCSPGKHPDGEACVECVAGTYKNSSGNTACLDCPPGVTNTETGQTTCDTCKNV